jgi:hypothetical protein
MACHVLARPGEFLVSDPKHARPERARGYLIDDAAVASYAREHGMDKLAIGTDAQDSFRDSRMAADSRPARR